MWYDKSKLLVFREYYVNIDFFPFFVSDVVETEVQKLKLFISNPLNLQSWTD